MTENKIEPILVETKVTGSQVAEVAVIAIVLSTRSDNHIKLTPLLLKKVSHTVIKQVSVNFSQNCFKFSHQ